MVQMREKAPLEASQGGSGSEQDAPLTLRLPPQWRLSERCLLELCSLNDPWRFERSAEGALEMTPPPGPLSSKRGGRIYAQILAWSDANRSGEAFESSAGFRLADASIRAAAGSWVSNERLAGIALEHEGAWPVCPDFVVAIRSRTDRLPRQQAKMRQWTANGARLGWLIDPFEGSVWVYRAGHAGPEQIARPQRLSCGGLLPGLSIDLSHVWR